MSARRLTLVRHGRSSYRYSGRVMMTRADMQLWRDGYDAAGIRDDDGPPPGLADLIASADLVIVSDLSRAIQTARKLTNAQVEISALVRETPPPIPDIPRLRMPRKFWDWITLGRWGFWIARGKQGPDEDLARAVNTANWLDDLSVRHPHIAVVTHGTFRRLLTHKLEHIGWRRSPGTRRSYDHWSVWSLDKP